LPREALASMFNHFTEMCCGTEADSYLRIIVSLNLRLKDLLGPVTRVKKKKGSDRVAQTWRGRLPRESFASMFAPSLIRAASDVLLLLYYSQA